MQYASHFYLFNAYFNSWYIRAYREKIRTRQEKKEKEKANDFVIVGNAVMWL